MSEQMLFHLQELLLAMRQVNRLIIREDDPDRLVQGICDRLAKNRCFLGAWIALTGEAWHAWTVVEAGCGDMVTGLTDRLRRGDLPGCCRIAVERSGGHQADPGSTCEDCPQNPSHERGEVLTVPLEHQGEPVGLLWLWLRPELALDGRVPSLVQEMADDVAFALRGIHRDRRLKEEQARWQSLVHNAPTLVLLLDRDCRIQFINRVGPGRSVDDVVGTSPLDHVGREFRQEASAFMGRVLRTGAIEACEVRGAGPDHASWYSVHAGPMLLDGQVDGITLCCSNITEKNKWRSGWPGPTAWPAWGCWPRAWPTRSTIR